MPVILLSAFIGGGGGFYGFLPYGFFFAVGGALIGGSIAALFAGGLLAGLRLRLCKII
ncbi:DUF3309 domain-containing protein [Methylobacterium sp. BTF04]|uniref:DUF3309 domain-containing protein n=1 Tax=Methylobacterium sp. BTF04 TaxID=2708300 RepID=UPI0013D494E0|nr:DUF3309 domain-containing protein [Methylobacterium sp. BTF04]NEU14468.1 DUF3309 domain-containing protein [Methylobacterium sp. BTF04]